MKIAQKLRELLFFYLLKHAPIQYIKLYEATRNRCKSCAL